MKFSLSRLVTALVRPLMRRLVSATVMPEHDVAALFAADKPVCYALQLRQLSSLVVLEETARRLGLPSPHAGLTIAGQQESAAFVFLTRAGQPSPLQDDPYRYSPRLTRLVDAVSAAVSHGDLDADCQIVPVSVLWGQSPRNDDSLLQLLAADTWIVPGFFQQALRVIVHGRHTLVRFGEPITLRDVVTAIQREQQAGGEADRALAPRVLRRIGRLLRARFRVDRMQALGPNLSHRQTVIESIVRSEPVREAIRSEAALKGLTPEQAELRARRFAVEIAADYSYPTIRALSLVFRWVFERLYQSIETSRFDVVSQRAGDATIVYVPSHRSHIDYMVLHYVLLERRMQVPHVAAGANLNIPVAGSILRRGGAFFLRRSFKGEALYAAVFERYLDTIIARGFPIEYFIEGGRSRTGRILPPKSGLLTMTVESYLRAPVRDVVFVPVNFAYERLVEGESYRNELAGGRKRKESLGALLRSLGILRQRFGRVYVNVGEPVSLAGFLRDNAALTARDQVDRLGRTLTRRINDAVTIGPVNLLAVALSQTPGGALDEAHLISLIDTLRELLVRQPYSPVQNLTALDGRAVIAAGFDRALLLRVADPAGDIIRLREQPPVLLAYFRNNVLHAWALFALAAVVVQSHGRLPRAQLIERICLLHPFAAAELFLGVAGEGPWYNPARPGHDDAVAARLAERVDQSIGLLADAGIVEYDGDSVRGAEGGRIGAIGLATLAGLVEQPLRRYLLVLNTLAGAQSGSLSRVALIERCALLGKRIGLLGNLNLPEILDPRLTGELIEALVETGWIEARDGFLHYGEALQNAAVQARRLLDDEVLLAIEALRERLPLDQPPSAQ